MLVSSECPHHPLQQLLTLIVGNNPFLGGLDVRDPTNLPALKKPHFIVCPNATLIQTVLEARAWFDPKAFDILVFNGSPAAAAEFWDEDGPLCSSNFFKTGEKHHIIVFTTHSVSFLICFLLLIVDATYVNDMADAFLWFWI